MAKADKIEKLKGKGDGYIWATGAAVTTTLSIAAVLLIVIIMNGIVYFWPSDLYRMALKDGTAALGELKDREEYTEGTNEFSRVQLKIGNRDFYSLDFKWFDNKDIESWSKPEDVVVLERLEYGNFFGSLRGLNLANIEPGKGSDWIKFQNALSATRMRLKTAKKIEHEMTELNNRTEALRVKRLKLVYKGREKNEKKIKELDAEMAEMKDAFAGLQTELTEQIDRLSLNTVTLVEVNGEEKELPIKEVVRAYRPNQMSIFSKCAHYLVKVGELLFDEPREANTEGGLFPAIFGTVMMVLIMSIFCMPMGIVAAIYLREYAKEGPVVRLVRIAVNNLAGVPSIVYGVFGLGFFVYGIGGWIDETFFPHLVANHETKMKTGGIFWASLTLSLLTVPVVIVATEEALASIPRGMREGSLALGATKWQTIRKVLLPMASPGILTGLILSMARAAGEVAPLMITGVVKLAPALPLDSQAPFLHLDRKFMHLGFHIYDVGFQSPNVEAAKPMVYVTTLLLLAIVILLNLTAIRVRANMRKKYTMGAF